MMNNVKCTGLCILLTVMALRTTAVAAPQTQDQAQRRPRIGLALSGGGARGAAHIGVLKVLEREGIKIDYIAGTSFGAIVGGLFACGYSADEIETIVTNHWTEIFSNQPERTRAPLLQGQNLRQLARLNLHRLNPSLPLGVLGGQKLIELINRYTLEPMLAADYDFDRLPIPFRAVSTDLLSGKPYVFRSGSISDAIRASISQPVFFSPWPKDGTLLVDGGLSDQLPTNIVRDMGADIVIAVDVTSPYLKYDEVHNAIDVIDQSLTLLVRQTVESHYRYADIVVQPDLNGYFYTSYPLMPGIIQRGVLAAENRIGDIRKLAGSANAEETERRHPAAGEPVIDSITFETLGQSHLQKVPSSYLLRQIVSRPNDRIDPETLGADVAQLYATGMFESVDYACTRVSGNRYRLAFHLTESARTTLGVSLRYDQEYKLQGLAEFTVRDLLGTPSYGTFSGRFGETGYESATLRMIHPKLSFIFLEPQAQLLNRDRFQYLPGGGTITNIDKRQGAQFMVGMTLLRRFEASAGYRFEMASFAPKESSAPNPPKSNLSGLRVRIRQDSLDAQEFPRTGMTLNLQADGKTKKLGADADYNLLQMDFHRYFSPSNKTTLGLRLAGMTSSGAVPFLERAFMGGYGYSDSASWRLVGFKRDEIIVPKMVLAGMSYRWQIFSQPLNFVRQGYVTMEYNVAAVGRQPASSPFMGTVHGAAVGFSMDTLLGPVHLAAGIGQAGKLRLYFSLGPSF